MYRVRPLALIFAALGVATPSMGQGFDYPDFADVSGLILVGNAQQSGNLLRVSPAAGNQSGVAYHGVPVRVANGFDTSFDFQFSGFGAGGADGMTFIIHNDPRGSAAIASGGGELAYGAIAGAPAGTAIANSLVVELDTWFSGGEADLSGNEVSIHTNGTGDNDNNESFSLGNISPLVNLSDGLMHTMRVQFDGSNLSVYLDDLFNPLISVAYDFTNGGQWIGGNPVGGLNLMAGGEAWVGFTSATGGAWENHDVSSWSFNASGGPGTPYCFGDSTSVVCPCGNLSANGEGCGNSMGHGSILASEGSSSVSVADFKLQAMQLPPNKPGLFVQASAMSGGGSSTFFHDGFRCVESSVTGIQLVFTNGLGMAQSGIDVISAGSVSAGSTKVYQFWYRDPFGPCGTGANATNGLQVSFNP